MTVLDQSPQPAAPGIRVTALLITHNGARWLPAALAALTGSTRMPDSVVAVDTGSRDESPDLVSAHLGTLLTGAVVGLEPSTPYAEAVRVGLARVGEAAAAERDWVWLLHDDAAPDPRCLETLVAEIDRAQDKTRRKGTDPVGAVGPKLREWPSLRRLLEVGLTISGTGKRETGLESGEYDQGQYDVAHQVLAVNSAGMLVRRDLLERLGFDDWLAVFGNDIDFGWRLARAGFATLVVPEAVMFHAEAAHRGARDAAAARRPRRDERAGAIYTLLANHPARTLPLRVVRLVLGGLLRSLGFLFVRAGRDAADELAALGLVLGAPGVVSRARRRRRDLPRLPAARRRLLAPFWVPYRHGLDFAADIGRALTSSVTHSVRRQDPRNAREDAPGQPGLMAALWSSSRVRAGLIALVVALVAGRALLGGAALHGGSLLPAPSGIGGWWGLWASPWHPLGAGTTAPGPAYLLPMAIAGTIALGNPGWVVGGLFVLTAPLAMVGALGFLRRLTPARWPAVVVAAGYALLPVVTGAVSQGRLGTVAGLVVLPWVAWSGLRLVSSDPDRRSRAGFRTALALGLLTAFVPLALPLAWLVTLAVILTGPLTRLPLPPLRRLAGPVAVALLLPVALVAPWLAGAVNHPGVWLIEAGRPDPAGLPALAGPIGLVLGRVSGGAPVWIGAGVVLAALIALLRPDTRPAVLRAWVAALAGTVAVVGLSGARVALPGLATEVRPYAGFAVAFVQACLLVAVACASVELRSWAVGPHRVPGAPVRTLAALGVVATVVTVVAGTAWWLRGGTPGPLTRNAPAAVPAYMLEQGVPNGGVLVLQRRGAAGLDYQVLRKPSLTLGDDGVLALTPPDDRLTTLVQRLITGARSGDARRLAAYGVSYVIDRPPVSPAVVGGLNAATGFGQASPPSAHAQAWRLTPPPARLADNGGTGAEHAVLLLAQLLALLGALVGALPGRSR